MKNIFQGIKKLPDFIYNNNKKIITISSLFMCAAFIWSYAILSMPMVTHEDSFFMFDDFEDEAVPLGLLDTDNLNGMLCPYQDVATHWAKDAIVKVCDEYQIMSPISDDMFEPNKIITRGEFVTTLGRLENIDIIDKKVKTFTDIKTDAFYMPYVAWAEENGILANEKNRKFRPNDLITREEMAVMMCHYLENVRGAILTGGNTFTDFDKISSWAVDDVMLVTGSMYMNGRSDGSFDPKSGVTRAELASLLARLIEEFDL